MYYRLVLPANHSVFGIYRHESTTSTKYNNENIEQKIEEVKEQGKTYADVVGSDGRKNNDEHESDFQRVMEKRNKELVEERERSNRASNLIVYGVEEAKSHNRDAENKQADEFVKTLFAKIETTVPVRSVSRLGQKKTDRTRPIKIVLNTEEEKTQVLSNLSKLKGCEEYRNVSITHDYTIAERMLIRAKSVEARAQNEKLPTNCEYTIQVRGNPKNGLILIRKYHKKDPPVTAKAQ